MDSKSYGSKVKVEFFPNLRQRFSYFFLIIFSILLMFFSKLDLTLISSLRSIISDIYAPVIYVFSRQTDLIDDSLKLINAYSNLKEQNSLLIEENDKLKKYFVILQQKKSENLILKKQLNLIPTEFPAFITARAISAPGSIYAHTLLIQIGKKDGIERGNAVLFDGALIGQIIDVGNISSRVLLISDVNSMIPIVLSNSRIPGILSGKNDVNLELKFLPIGINPYNGELVQTSGHGGLFPPGIPIGNIRTISNNKIIINPIVNLNSIDFVQILKWRLNNLEQPTNLNTKNYKPLKNIQNQNLFEGLTVKDVIE